MDGTKEFFDDLGDAMEADLHECQFCYGTGYGRSETGRIDGSECKHCNGTGFKS